MGHFRRTASYPCCFQRIPTEMATLNMNHLHWLLIWIEAKPPQEGANPEESWKRHWGSYPSYPSYPLTLLHTDRTSCHGKHPTHQLFWHRMSLVPEVKVKAMALLSLRHWKKCWWRDSDQTDSFQDWMLHIVGFGVGQLTRELKRAQFQLRHWSKKKVWASLCEGSLWTKHWNPPIITFSPLTTKSQTKVMEDLIIQPKRLRFQFEGGGSCS